MSFALKTDGAVFHTEDNKYRFTFTSYGLVITPSKPVGTVERLEIPYEAFVAEVRNMAEFDFDDEEDEEPITSSDVEVTETIVDLSDAQPVSDAPPVVETSAPAESSEVVEPTEEEQA